MQKSSFKITISFLLTFVTGAKVAKIKIGLLDIQCNCLNNNLFCYHCYTKFGLSHIPLCHNNSGFDYWSFSY